MRSTGLQRLVRRTSALNLVLVAVVMVVAIGALLAYREQAREADAVREALVGLERTRGDVLSAETGLRGFVLTRAPEFLVPYEQALPQVRAELRALAPDLPARERRDLQAAGRLVDEWRREFAEPILRDLRAKRAAQALALIDTGAGKRRIDGVRRLLASIGAAERERLTDAQATLDRLAAIGLTLIGLVFALATGVALFLRRRLHHAVVRPIAQLAEVATAVGEGDLDRRVEPGGVAEVETLGAAFNDMAGRIEETVLRLHELDELRTGFVSTVSHELRNPVQTIQGYVEELADPGGDPLTADQLELLEVVSRNAGVLEALIDDLLLLGRMDAGRLQLDRAEVDVVALLQELCDELGPARRDRALDVVLDAPESGLVHGDRRRLRQTFANLLSNAVKFSPPEGRIVVRAREEGECVVVEVADQGPGIPADELPRIAERFFRASTAKGVRGTGLGLTISREIAERHGGRLEVRSQVGEGSTFRVQLPRAGR